MEVLDILYIVVAVVMFVVAVVVSTSRFLRSVIKEKGKEFWTKFADWIENIINWLP